MQHSNRSQRSHTLHKWELGLVATAAGVISAPYVLPLIGVGDAVDVQNVVQTCVSNKGGLAHLLETSFSKVPLIGSVIGTVGWANTLTAGAIGILGVLAGDYIHRHYDRKGHIPWGKIIKYTALTTSILIALPSILSGISMGITYIASQIGGAEGLIGARDFLKGTLGFSGMEHASPTGLAGLLPHLFTCGRALLPTGVAWFASRRNAHAVEKTGYHCRLVAPCVPMRGQPCEVCFQLVDRETGRPLEDSELQILHTRPLHTMIVDSSLRDYHHLHPTYDRARKCFVAQFTPNLQTSYTMWNDFTVKGEEAATHLRTELSPLRGVHLPPRIQHASQVESAGLCISIQPDTTLRAGRHHTLTLDIRDASGRPVTDLEPIMGAYAHLVAFSADGQHFMHSHPLAFESKQGEARGRAPLLFHVMPEVAGPMQFFLQIQRGGRTITVPFGQIVCSQTQSISPSASKKSFKGAPSDPSSALAAGRTRW